MLQNILVFLIATVLSLYIGAVLLRFLLAYFRADFHNPFSQFLVTITSPVLKPLRRYIPPMGKLDTSSLALAFALKLIGVILISALMGLNLNIFTMIIAALAGLVRTLIWIFMFAVIIQAILSWVGNSYNNPVTPILNALTDPLLRPVRRHVPLISGIDLSPLVVIIGLQVLLIVLDAFPDVF